MFGHTLKRSFRISSRLGNGNPSSLISGNAAPKTALPSTAEMKSLSLWSSSTEGLKPSGKFTKAKSVAGETSFTQQLMGFTQTVVEADPPLKILPRFTKRFREGDTYDAFDLSATRIGMDRKNRKLVRKDPFEATGINPRNLYTMPEILSKFLTSTGQVLPRSVTGCSDANQKKLSMAVKTARASGLLSSTHRLAKFIPSSLL